MLSPWVWLRVTKPLQYNNGSAHLSENKLCMFRYHLSCVIAFPRLMIIFELMSVFQDCLVCHCKFIFGILGRLMYVIKDCSKINVNTDFQSVGQMFWTENCTRSSGGWVCALIRSVYRSYQWAVNWLNGDMGNI